VEEIGLRDASEMDKKRGVMVSIVEIITLRRLKEAGIEELRKLSK
jgi:hypothetical protein